MERKKRIFTQEFRDQAVELAKTLGSVSKAARELGVHESGIRVWKRKAEAQLALQSQDSSLSIEAFNRLKTENEKLKKVNQILKMAAAFFSQDHLK